MIRSSTSVMPGADQATVTASSRSAQELTFPESRTMPGRGLSTDSSNLSSLAPRPEAALIACWMSPWPGAGCSEIATSTPMTPGTAAQADSASWRWNCQAATPDRVTKPASTLASTVADEVVQHQGLPDVSTKVSIRPPVPVRDVYLQVVADDSDPVDAPGGVIRLGLLSGARACCAGVTVPPSTDTVMS
jgi:hypothetical protein